VDKETPLQMSNVAPIDPDTDRPTRVGVKVLGTGSGCGSRGGAARCWRSNGTRTRVPPRGRGGNAEVEMARLAEKYKTEVVPALTKEFGYESVMAVPRVKKVVVNMGVGEAIQDAKLLDQAAEELATIAGQRPAITRARKSIANFKLRAGMAIGCRVTLRGGGCTSSWTG